MLDRIKIALRITSSAYDEEIEQLILAAKTDLYLSGVEREHLEGEDGDGIDAILERAITTYCKANFGMDNPDSEKFQRSYDSLKNHLGLSSDYGDRP